MKRYEYKTIELKLKGAGMFGPGRAEGFDEILNREGAAGWRYVETIPATEAFGQASRLKLVFEREIE
ncbi:MAG TPA: DUF4177 domain-containing protein [Anaerohalosphaeraceae bacterium]|nr:DUF4177 domain-containing protein [Anaerohalosphaeraceae bacterium]HRT85177.1 DUF4177 domain-containing protein [Anaerohalosphaeraceae bacterium]